MIYEENILLNLTEKIKNFKIDLKEDDILNLLKIEKRWPVKYPWGQDTISVINNLGTTSSDFLFDRNSYLNFDKWFELYNLGYTTIISHVLDLTKDLRELNNMLLQELGIKVHANFYFSKPGQKPSFDEHSHPYYVIVKQIYGETLWLINQKQINLKSQETLLIPINTKHSVIDKTEKKLSLTINLNKK